MKVVQKSIRLTQRVYDYIEQYRGDNFCDKLQNYVLDTEERRNQLSLFDLTLTDDGDCNTMLEKESSERDRGRRSRIQK